MDLPATVEFLTEVAALAKILEQFIEMCDELWPHMKHRWHRDKPPSNPT
jgi:hypothetical protein